METLVAFLYIIFGLLVRLAIPILGTVLLVYFLRRLDARWQVEAQLHQQSTGTFECWKIQGVSPQQTKDFETSQSELPCWQVNRLPNGYMRDECLSCQVFTEAPAPTLKTEPRRL